MDASSRSALRVDGYFWLILGPRRANASLLGRRGLEYTLRIPFASLALSAWCQRTRLERIDAPLGPELGVGFGDER